MTVRELLEEVNPEALLMDGLEDACVGVARQFNSYWPIYSLEKILQLLVARDGLNREEALEHYEFNIVGGWHGAQTPFILEEMPYGS